MGKRLFLGFAIPVSVALLLLVLRDHILPTDPNLKHLPNGMVLAPYDDYGPRNIDLYFTYAIITIFGIGLLLPAMFWYRNRRQ